MGLGLNKSNYENEREGEDPSEVKFGAFKK